MNETSIEIFEDTKFLLHHIKFSILLVLQIPAIVLSLIIFIYIIKHRALREAPQNHGMLILLTVNFMELVFDMPQILSFYVRGYVNPATSIHCTWWTFFAFSIYAISEYSLATISIQRHIFIFNKQILRGTWKRITLHYLPFVFCIIYPIIFYFFAIILYPCDGTQWDFTNNMCGYAPCYLLYNHVLGTYDTLMNNYIPMVIDVITNVIMIIRVIRKKRRAQRSINRRQQRRMITQLLVLSIIYLIALSPVMTVTAVQILYDSTFLAQIQIDYLYDLGYIIYLFVPWAYLGFFPEIVKWIKQLFKCRQTNNAVGITQTHNVAQNIEAPHHTAIA